MCEQNLPIAVACTGRSAPTSSAWGCCRDERRDARPARGPRGRCLGGRSRWCVLPANPTSQRPCPQLVAVQIAAPHVQEGRPDLVPPRLWIMLDEADGSQRAEDAVDGPFRKSQLPRQLGNTQPAGSPGEEQEDGLRLVRSTGSAWAQPITAATKT